MLERNDYGCVKTQIERIPVEIGESIEEMVRRCTATNEPIEATAPLIYTEEKDGRKPEHDMRADRFDIALDAVDKYNASIAAKSGNAPEQQVKPSGQETVVVAE